MTLDNIVKAIQNANDIVVLTHDIPDGDAIGSSMAMYLSLKQMGKNVDVVIPDFPENFKFLPCVNEIKKEGKKESYDVAIALDCGDIKRLGELAKCFENANTKIQIDHHKINSMFGDYNFVNPMSPACCQVLIVVLESLGIEITEEIGACLLAGIITDTGGFKYQGVTAETFEFTAALLNKGVNVSNIYKRVMQVVSKARFELTKRAMNRMEFLEDGKIAFTYITKEDEEETNSGMNDHEGIVEKGRDVEGVEVSIFIREKSDGYKISLRSNDYVNVADICLMFSGGGHIKAAGGEMTGTFEQVKEKIVAACVKKL